MKLISSEMCYKFFTHSLKYYQKAYMNEPFSGYLENLNKYDFL